MTRVAPIVVAAVLFAACGGSTPGSPSSTPVGFEGRWTGTVLPGGAFAFTVSRDQNVTSIEFDYQLNGCTGRVSAANLNLRLFEYPPVGTSFEYRSTDFTQPNYVTVFGSFKADGTVAGYVGFGQYTNCGDGVGLWTAHR